MRTIVYSALAVILLLLAGGSQPLSAQAKKVPLKTDKKILALVTDTVVRVLPSTIGPYCPKKLLGGDREFDGHGPEVWAWIKLTIVSNKYIDATVYMHARETTSDWSETEGTWTKRIYTAPDGFTIREILTGKYSEVHYVSRPGVRSFSPAGLRDALGDTHGTDVPFKDDGLVSRWNIVGDTSGRDISDDDDPHDDTQVAIQLNVMRVKLRRSK